MIRQLFVLLSIELQNDVSEKAKLTFIRVYNLNNELRWFICNLLITNFILIFFSFTFQI